MEKLVSVAAKVEDLWGLYVDLRKASFAVRNVAADEKGTHVYLDEGEEKDPLPIVESWAGKPAPPATREAADKRRKEFEELNAERPDAGRRKGPSLVARLFRRIF